MLKQATEKQATEEATRAVEKAQTGRATAKQAQKVAEDKLVAAEKMLVEERKNIDVLKGQLEAFKKASENALKRNTQTILALQKDLGQSKATVSTATEDFKASAEYLAEKTLNFVGGFEQAKKAFQKKFPEADLQGIDPETPLEGETTTEAEQSGGEEDQDDAQS